jgi:DNA mismatch repair protein MutS2
MIYPLNFEQKIGFDKIRQLIAAHCLFSPGEEKVAAMAFSSDRELICTLLARTQEFTRIIREESRFPCDYFLDVRAALKRIRVEGTYLTEKELFDVRRSLETVNEIVRFFQLRQKEEHPPYPHLQELASGVSSFSRLTGQIDSILDKFGQIKDNASPALADIRRQLAQTAGGISKTLQSILRAARSEGLVEKDVEPAMRDGRLVIPVSPAYKRKFKGIVHDESATGKTVFIEPAEVVEANNKIRALENEEKREIIRILTAFTGLIRPLTPEVETAYRFLAEIDFIRAKALFGLEIEATFPAVEERQGIDWIHAVNPLLYLSHKKQGKPVVPLDMELSVKDREQRILIISGPNAGGKSVLLKTAGLLQYMLQSGLPVPAGERSRAGLFKDIFLDIGDEQSIENDLSTYSSHLANMKFMVKNARPESLILIDEFGSGTEPQIGGALAEALLHRFNEKRSFGIITTHYHNLKIFAESHPGVVNGAMLYDRHQMHPLFQLSIGNPGSSFAIEIARKTGLPEDVIAEAAAKVGQDYVNMDKYLQDIVRDKRYWEAKRQQIHQQEKRLEELAARYRSDLEEIGMQRKTLIAQAKTQAEHLLSETNARIENTIREIKEAQAEREKTREIRKSLETFKESLREETESGGTDLPESSRIKKRKAAKKKPEPAIPPETGSRKIPIAVGDAVRIKGQRAVGVVIDKKDKNFVLAFGNIKTTVKEEQVEKAAAHYTRAETRKPALITANSSESMSEKKLHFKPEIDVRGMRGDEALQAVTYYIDDAIQCNAGRVRILHGTGTGALRQIIRDYLKTVSGVHRFQDEHIQFGGGGITVVEC